MRAVFLGAMSLFLVGTMAVAASAPEWSPQDFKGIKPKSPASLPPIPMDRSNRTAIHSELCPLKLNDQELAGREAFHATLDP